MESLENKLCDLLLTIACQEAEVEQKRIEIAKSGMGSLKTFIHQISPSLFISPLDLQVFANQQIPIQYF